MRIMRFNPVDNSVDNSTLSVDNSRFRWITLCEPEGYPQPLIQVIHNLSTTYPQPNFCSRLRNAFTLLWNPVYHIHDLLSGAPSGNSPTTPVLKRVAD